MSPLSTKGPLRVHPHDGRYLVDGAGRTVLLTGSHTWTVIQDAGIGPSPEPFDYEAWLDELVHHGHDFFRAWVWEQARWVAHRLEDDFWLEPMPFERTGPGVALDGAARYDLSRFDERYFQRLRDRVEAAGRRGIYVAVMLFQGWSVDLKTFGLSPGRDPWPAHPYHRDNNINAIDGDPDDEGHGRATQTMRVPAVQAVQRRYIARVVEAVSDLDNVIYEVGNEFAATPENSAWQEWVIDAVREEQRSHGSDRLVWRTICWPSPASHAELYTSSAELISVNDPARHGIGTEDYCYDPPAADARKVSVLDTDHLWGVGGDAAWVWRAFMRGHHPIFMDPWESDFVVTGPYGIDARPAMGVVRRLADRFDLAEMRCRPEWCSTRYAIELTDGTIICWTPRPDPFTLDLSDATGTFRQEWLHPVTGLGLGGARIVGEQTMRCEPPYRDGSVLILSPVA